MVSNEDHPWGFGEGIDTDAYKTSYDINHSIDMFHFYKRLKLCTFIGK